MNLEKNSIMIEVEDSEEEAMKSFFFDTYAFFEILNGSENYRKYISVRIITSKLNLFELYSKILRESNEEEAHIALEEYYIIGQEIAVYTNLDDLVLQIDYFLNNDTEREKIKKNGYKRRSEYSYEKIYKSVFEKIKVYK